MAPPAIKVVYPRNGQEIGPVDSTFVIGSVTPGARLSINGTPIEVYRTGGFLAWLPVEKGPFTFKLRATDGVHVDSVDVPVVIADPRPIPPDSGLLIRNVRPSWNRTIRAGDEIEIRFDGTVGCSARFWIVGPADSIGPLPMTELHRQRYSDFQTYRKDAIFEEGPGEAQPPAEGRYTGVWKVPEITGAESLKVRVELTGPPRRWIDQYRHHYATHFGPPTPVDTTVRTIRTTAPGGLRPVDGLPPRVVEFTDSVQTLRMGPRLGYLTIFQPYGVRTRWWGEAGPWTILKLAPGYTAWLEKNKTRLLPEGVPVPESYIARMFTKVRGNEVQFRVGTSERLPFKITVDDNLLDIQIILFGATSNTDWIEYDPDDDLIENITWSQTQPGLYIIDLRLTQPLWGYDAFYDEKQFVLEIKRPPYVRHGLEGLTIAIDAGHSSDPGAVGPTGLMEKDANLKIAWQVHGRLKERGARVVMTRLGDEHVALYDRPSISVAEDVDLFVSVHNNAVPDGVNPYYRNGTSTYYYHTFSRDFARHIHRRLLDATGLPDYGLTNGNFAVIRPTHYPSVLVECAFIIIPEQEELLMDDDFIERTANGIVTGIEDFIEARLRR
ncbi:MAG: hypothetical protein Kow0074_10570 [Candidatus Zixiibacteriota bacterium]